MFTSNKPEPDIPRSANALADASETLRQSKLQVGWEIDAWGVRLQSKSHRPWCRDFKVPWENCRLTFWWRRIWAEIEILEGTADGLGWDLF